MGVVAAGQWAWWRWASGRGDGVVGSGVVAVGQWAWWRRGDGVPVGVVAAGQWAWWRRGGGHTSRQSPVVGSGRGGGGAAATRAGKARS